MRPVSTPATSSVMSILPLAGRLLSALLLLSLAGLAGASETQAQPSKKIDASDPTKIYTYIGVGPKYTDYTNDESMWEARTSGNIGMNKDMIFFNIGYGVHSGDKVAGSNSGVTNARVRWFHLFQMDYGITHGYRGWATQIDAQIAGALKGTDGQNVISVGALPAFGLSPRWSLFVPVNLVNSWDKQFENNNGFGFNVSPLLVYAPGDAWWDGAYIQFWPGYTRFTSGYLKGEGAGNLDITLGGRITPVWLWTLLYQKRYDKDLRSFRRGKDTGLVNDWNLFFNLIRYF